MMNRFLLQRTASVVEGLHHGNGGSAQRQAHSHESGRGHARRQDLLRAGYQKPALK